MSIGLEELETHLGHEWIVASLYIAMYSIYAVMVHCCQLVCD